MAVNFTTAQVIDKENDGFTLFLQSGFNVLDTKEREVFTQGKGTKTTDLKGDEVEFTIHFETIGSFFVIPSYFALGLGSGIDMDIKEDYYSVPVFLDARLFLFDYYHSPYLYLDYGGFLDLGGKYNRGVLLNFGAGVSVPTNSDVSIVLDAKYSLRVLSLTGEKVSTSDDTITYKGWIISIGLRF